MIIIIEVFKQYKKFCFKNGKLKIKHNEYGPATKVIDIKSYQFNNKLHNELGPSIVFGNSKYYYLNNKRCNEKEWKKQLK